MVDEDKCNLDMSLTEAQTKPILSAQDFMSPQLKLKDAIHSMNILSPDSFKPLNFAHFGSPKFLGSLQLKDIGKKTVRDITDVQEDRQRKGEEEQTKYDLKSDINTNQSNMIEEQIHNAHNLG